jgi:hypothetical protein
MEMPRKRLLCKLTPKVQCRLVHRNHVIWRTKITKFWQNGNDTKQPYSTWRSPSVFLYFNSIYISLLLNDYCSILFMFISAVYIPMLLYVYYYGMMDHSGIKMDALWPWQPPSIFHDNHHKYVINIYIYSSIVLYFVY